MISVPELEDDSLTAEEAEEYHACREYMETVKKNIKFIPLELESDETVVGEVMPDICTYHLNGEEITNSIFAEKDLTVVNIWGTFCAPCIEEMPELEELNKKYGEQVQVLGIVGDVEGLEDTEHLELAKTITEKAGVQFTNVVINDDFKDFMSGIIGFPTTIFVDNAGNIVGDPIVGSDIAATEEYIKSMNKE